MHTQCVWLTENRGWPSAASRLSPTSQFGLCVAECRDWYAKRRGTYSITLWLTVVHVHDCQAAGGRHAADRLSITSDQRDAARLFSHALARPTLNLPQPIQKHALVALLWTWLCGIIIWVGLSVFSRGYRWISVKLGILVDGISRENWLTFFTPALQIGLLGVGVVKFAIENPP